MSSTLMATVAHELRNPLTSLRLSLDMLVSEVDDLPPERTLELIQRANRSVAWLNSLTENLTSVASVGTDHLAIDPTPIDVRRCIDEAIMLVHALLAQRGQSVRVFVESCDVVLGDPARVVQVVANLLGNACRYSVDGDVIEVHVSATEEFVRVRVIDHGPGISPDDQQRIFSAWERGKSACSGGLGLGLNIVQDLVQRLGGRVGVESALGHGATFWFTLPTLS
jgi:signal transduction histidine kinase